jgi:ADP-heptose:LPS heptosyltransferase
MSGRSYSLAGRLTIEEMAGVLQISPLLISNNSGPVHLAAGLGTPVVVLSALTNPQHAPWNVPSRVLSHDVPCKYCYKTICPEGHHNCLRLITPSTVIEAARSLLQETAIRQDTPARIG